MKSHLAKVSLALMSTAFMLGCQDQGSPTQPTLLAMVTTSGSASYDVTHSGAVTTDPTEVDGIPGPGKKSQQVQITRGNKIVFTDAFANMLGDNAEECFPRTGGNLNDPRDAIRFSGALNPVKKKSKVTGQYFFRALGTDGSTERQG